MCSITASAGSMCSVPAGGFFDLIRSRQRCQGFDDPGQRGAERNQLGVGGLARRQRCSRMRARRDSSSAPMVAAADLTECARRRASS
jgi:hypothetical protein